MGEEEMQDPISQMPPTKRVKISATESLVKKVETRGRKTLDFDQLKANNLAKIEELDAQIKEATSLKDKRELKNKRSSYKSRLSKGAKSKNVEDVLQVRNKQLEIMLSVL